MEMNVGAHTGNRVAIWGLGLVLIFVGSTRAFADEAKTLTRFHDPVILKTTLLKELTDHRTANYRLYSARSGVLVPIPFQFDARDEGGDLVFPDTEAEQEFIFDKDDELVFMAKDTGDRITPTLLPVESDRAIEIEVTDPVSGRRGWAYLLHFPASPPPVSPIRYATFDPRANQARALFYTIDYYAGRNFFTGMRIHPTAGGTGDNILDRTKVRINPTFSLVMTTWSPLFTEEDMTTTMDGVKNGPVRAIRRVRQSLDLSRFIPAIPNGTTYTYFYFSSFVTPSKFTVPWLVLKLLHDFRFTGVSDFRKNALGTQYWDAANPQGLRFTGANHAFVKTTVDHDWHVVSGKAGTFLQAFLIPEQWSQWGIVRGSVFEDDDLAADREGPEDEAGIHAAGYSLLNMMRLRESGAYDMSMAVVFLPRLYQRGDEVEPLAMLKQPLLTEVHRVK